MAPIALTQSCGYDQSLHSAALELKYERSTHLVDIISKDESIRKLRFEVHILEDDNAELHDLLAKEEDRSERLEKIVGDHLARAEDAEAALQEVDDELQAREQELSTLRAESSALKNITSDASKTLSEKLELTRELSTLKPELEHLRTQNATNKDILSEKLALQRQLSEFQIQLEQSKREAQRALAKRRNTQHELAQEDELDTLQKSVKREKRLREKAEEALEQLQTELDEQKKAAQRLMSKETKKVEHDSAYEVRSEELSRELAKEKKDRTKAEKALQQAQSEWEAQKAVWGDKLGQFRTKLKTTKDRLSEAETALEKAQQEEPIAPKRSKKTAGETAATKPSRKRTAVQMDPDATNLGTPGDGAVKKRGRKTSTLGEKSSFSITPFLNRTMSVAPDSPEERHARGRQESVSEAEASPTAASKPSKANPVSKKKQPLAPVPPSKTNIKKAVPARKKVTLPGLEKVVEEDESSQPKQATAAPAAAPPAEPAMKPKASKPDKMRKSLAAFATFNLEPEPEKKKKRKLGGLGKTLFDEEDDAPKALPGSRALFGGVRMGPLGGFGAVTKGSFLGGAKKSALMSTDDGFQFSPLKKDRKMMSFVK